MHDPIFHRPFLPEAFAEPLGAPSESHDWKPSPSINWSQASPITRRGGEWGERAGKEDGEGGTGRMMTSRLDIAPGGGTTPCSGGGRPASPLPHPQLEQRYEGWNGQRGKCRAVCPSQPPTQSLPKWQECHTPPLTPTFLSAGGSYISWGPSCSAVWEAPSLFHRSSLGR